MRRSKALEVIWRRGQFYGLDRSHGRVTVTPDWTLSDVRAAGSAMADRRQPARWFQDAAGTQTEIEIPVSVIRRVQINRAKNSDCATLTMTLRNADPDGGPSRRKQGMFSQRRSINGVTLVAEGEARWGPEGLEPNDWSTVETGAGYHNYGRIAQGNMLRTYQGYGGYTQGPTGAVHKPLADALNAGNIVKTGIWRIDKVRVNATGDIEVIARDTGVLLVDQPLYPPLVPDGCYPIQFYSATWNLETTGNPRGQVPSSTNYRDLADPVRLIALWCGFHLKGAPTTGGGRWPAVLGGIEDTGIESPSPLPASMFDKRPAIDAIKAIAEIVAYDVWIDQEGGLRFNSPNIWEAGNFDYDGVHHRFAFDLDENNVLVSYDAEGTVEPDRSSITAAMADPAISAAGRPVKIAAFDTWTSSTKNQLHNMKSPAIIPIANDIPLREMVTIAELTGLRVWFARRRGRASGPANPLIDVGDQVRIWERVTFDTHLHLVNSITTDHDFETGVYTQTLETNWLGADNDDWVIRVGPDGHVIYNTSAADDARSSAATNDARRRHGHLSQPDGVLSDQEALAR